jgi:hypothetical protein
MVKYVLSLEDVPQYEALDTEELIQEVRRLENMQRELNVRHKLAKQNLMEALRKQDNKTFRNDKYIASLTEVKSQRIDSQWVKNFVEEQGVQPVMKESVSERLNIKRVD